MPEGRADRWAVAGVVCVGLAMGALSAERGRTRPTPRRADPPRAPLRGRIRPALALGLTILLVAGGLSLATTEPSEPGGDPPLRTVARQPHVPTRPDPAEPPAPLPAEVAVAVAQEQLGKPYRWAAAGPNSFDCSGLTSFVWRAAGVELPRTSRGQFASLPRVPLDDLQPGDLVYSPGHIGLYVGDGQMIHAPVSGRHVEVAPLRPRLTGAVRPVPTA